MRREARLTLRRFPQMAKDVHSTLGDVLWHEKRYEEALREYRLEGSADFPAFEQAYERGGPRAARLALADRLRRNVGTTDQPPDWLLIARYYAEAGQADTAFALLDKAFAMRQPRLLHLVADPAFDALRQDPRYEDLLRRIGIHP